MDFFRALARHLYERLNIGKTLTGVLGLAIALLGYYFRLRSLRNGGDERDPHDAVDRRSVQGEERAAGTGGASQKAQAEVHAARDSAHARAVRSRLQGVRRVTLSCPGVLLQPGPFRDAAVVSWAL